jgi:hypothetical protein
VNFAARFRRVLTRVGHPFYKRCRPRSVGLQALRYSRWSIADGTDDPAGCVTNPTRFPVVALEEADHRNRDPVPARKDAPDAKKDVLFGERDAPEARRYVLNGRKEAPDAKADTPEAGKYALDAKKDILFG